MTSTADLHPLYRRDRYLVAEVLEHIARHEDGAGWADLLEEHSSPATNRRTVENTLYDLVSFGAIARHGRPGSRGKPDTRSARMTTLGRAWLFGLDLPTLGADRYGDEAELTPLEVEDYAEAGILPRDAM